MLQFYIKKKGKRTFGSSVDVLSRVHSLGGDKVLGSLSESVWISECDSGKGSSSAGVMENLLYDTSDVPRHDKEEM